MEGSLGIGRRDKAQEGESVHKEGSQDPKSGVMTRRRESGNKEGSHVTRRGVRTQGGESRHKEGS